MVYIYVPFNTRPKRGNPYFAIGGVHWTAKGARNFMGNEKQWRTLSRQGWKIFKCKLDPPNLHRRRSQ